MCTVHCVRDEQLRVCIHEDSQRRAGGPWRQWGHRLQRVLRDDDEEDSGPPRATVCWAAFHAGTRCGRDPARHCLVRLACAPRLSTPPSRSTSPSRPFGPLPVCSQLTWSDKRSRGLLNSRLYSDFHVETNPAKLPFFLSHLGPSPEDRSLELCGVETKWWYCLHASQHCGSMFWRGKLGLRMLWFGPRSCWDLATESSRLMHNVFSWAGRPTPLPIAFPSSMSRPRFRLHLFEASSLDVFESLPRVLGQEAALRSREIGCLTAFWSLRRRSRDRLLTAWSASRTWGAAYYAFHIIIYRNLSESIRPSSHPAIYPSIHYPSSHMCTVYNYIHIYILIYRGYSRNPWVPRKGFVQTLALRKHIDVMQYLSVRKRVTDTRISMDFRAVALINVVINSCWLRGFARVFPQQTGVSQKMQPTYV